MAHRVLSYLVDLKLKKARKILFIIKLLSFGVKLWALGIRNRLPQDHWMVMCTKREPDFNSIKTYEASH